MNKIFGLITMMILTTSCDKNLVKTVTTDAQNQWVEQEVNTKVEIDDATTVTVETKNKLQKIDGFGACFNELGWDALESLSASDRSVVMNELFTPDLGANLTICRMPLGANDFSIDWYSYNETEGDFAMDNFSIVNDYSSLIPYIQTAQKYNPNLRVWASPWCPPSWMKWNKHYACATSGVNLDKEYQNHLPTDAQGREGTNMFIQEDKYFMAYASYFSKFIQAYKEKEIDIEMVMPQNEYNSCQVFPSCTWTANGLATFTLDYLVPEMDKLGVDVMLGTVERPALHMIDTILSWPNANQGINGVGFQWAGKDALPKVAAKYPDMKLYQTEQECGNGKNDWDHCEHSWNLMKHYLSNGVEAYMYWNIALKQGGISRWGWSQNSFVTVNKTDKTYHFNFEYYLFKHVSHFVKPGAHLLAHQGSEHDVLVFQNPDQSIILVMYNAQDENKNVSVKIDDETFNFTLDAKSFMTVSI